MGTFVLILIHYFISMIAGTRDPEAFVCQMYLGVALAGRRAIKQPSDNPVPDHATVTGPVPPELAFNL